MDEIKPLEFSEDGFEMKGYERNEALDGKMEIILDGKKISLNFKEGLLDGPGMIDGVGKMNFSQDELLNIKLNSGNNLDFTKK
jgi:hypothetical protein